MFKGSHSFPFEIWNITKHMCLHGLDTRAKNVFKVKKKKIRGRKSPLIEKNLRQYKENNISVSESLP